MKLKLIFFFSLFCLLTSFSFSEETVANNSDTLVTNNENTTPALGWENYKDKIHTEIVNKLETTDFSISKKSNAIDITIPVAPAFDKDNSIINPDFYKQLNTLADVLVEYPESRIIIESYTDSSGDPKFSKILSQRRAQSLASYFSKRTIDPDRLSSVGYGATNFIADNTIPQEKPKNNRIEIKILPAHSYDGI